MLKNINSFIIGIILLSGIPMLPAEPNKSSQELQHNIINKNPILVFDNIQNNNLIDNKVIPQIPKRYRIAIHLNPPLHASASAQINLLDLQYLIAEIKKQSPNLANKKIFIVDLRQEPHAILNQNAVSWYGFKNQVANQLEQELIDKLANQSMVKVYQGIHKLPDGHFMPKTHLLVKPEQVITEQALIESLGLNYLRILVTDHFAPENEQIDKFINFIKKIPKNSWIHFHCRGGRGRATTFMTMLDIINNSNLLTLEDILIRQQQIGGIALSKIKFNAERKKWKEPAAAERYDFIKKFYDYVTDPKGYKLNSWSDWIKNQEC